MGGRVTDDDNWDDDDVDGVVDDTPSTKIETYFSIFQMPFDFIFQNSNILQDSHIQASVLNIVDSLNF